MFGWLRREAACWRQIATQALENGVRERTYREEQTAAFLELAATLRNLPAALNPERVDPNLLLPSDVPLRCPACKTDQPAEPIAALRSPVQRGGAVVSLPTGAVYACMRCPEVYCVGPNGVFHQHSDSLTYVRARREPEPSSNGEEWRPTQAELNEEPRSERLVARERPPA